MPSSSSAVASTAAASFFYRRDPEQITQAKSDRSGYIVGSIVGAIIGTVLLWYAVTYIYGTIRYKVWIPWKVRRAEKRDRVRRSTGTNVEIGEATPAYERQRRENLRRESVRAKEWSWRTMMSGTEDTYP
jgi:hypothetical protein